MMHQYSYHLVLLIIAVISALSCSPCQAQTLPDSNSDKIKVIIPISSVVDTSEDTTQLPQVRDSASSNSQGTILSETTSNTSLATTKSNLRIPISSRIFSGTSMQQ